MFREDITDALAPLRGQLSSFSESIRPQIVTALQPVWLQQRQRIQITLADNGDGLACASALASLADTVITALADATLPNTISLAALGGYGRGELAPFSDIDLLFLLPDNPTQDNAQAIETFLYVLWDLGLKVGHAVRSVDDCIQQARADVTVRTSLLDARFLWGNQSLFDQLATHYRNEVQAGTGPAFLHAKLDERDARHLKLGDSRYLLEPNIKDGKGGLRDLHTLFWIIKDLYGITTAEQTVTHRILSAEEAVRLLQAYAFLWTVRCHLHFIANRADDRLTFDHQTEVSRRMGFTDGDGVLGIERFMKQYFLIAKDVGDLTRTVCAALEADAKRPVRQPVSLHRTEVEGFPLDSGRLSVSSQQHFRQHPVDLIRLFRVAQRHKLDIHPYALRTVQRSLRLIGPKLRDMPEAHQLFLDILTSRKDPEVTLRRMSEAGVLGRFLPEFGQIVAQMQYDMYHVFTVDEHTLFAVGLLHRIETGKKRDELPLASSIMPQIASRRALYVAMLLHDIAKGRGGDHSVLGAEVAERLCPRLGLSTEETETVAWLVRWHLALSHAAFKRDLDDPKTIQDIVDLVQSPERLRLLLVLTTADISAVGPGRWTQWKASLLTELYYRVLENLSGGLVSETRTERVKAIQTAVRSWLTDWSDEDAETFLSHEQPAYWLAFTADTLARHARLMREADQQHRLFALDMQAAPARAATEVTIYTADHPGLFAQLAGSLALCGADIVDARIFTTTNGMALDVFWVQDTTGGSFDTEERQQRLSATLEGVLSGSINLQDELTKRKPSLLSGRTRHIPLPPRVLFDNRASSAHTVVEVNGRNRPGLLYDLTRTFTEVGVQISSAKIGTHGDKVVDVFYVKNAFGLKVDHEAKLAQLKAALLEVLN